MGSRNKHIELRVVDETIERELQESLNEIEAEIKQEGIAISLFNVIMELITNAVKANLKRVYFQAHGFDFNDPDSYRAGVAEFTRDYRKTNTDLYHRALKELQLAVKVDMDLDQERLLISISNNTILIAEEERRIRFKLARAMGSKDIMDFYVAFGDETEGKGLGLAMVVLLIKDMGFDPANFRVFRGEGKTTARIEFPLSADYVTIRDRFRESNTVDSA